MDSVFTALPKERVTAIAGIALLGTIRNSMHCALRDEGEREAALITFLVTASGLTLIGIGSGFLGFVARPGRTEARPAPAGMTA